VTDGSRRIRIRSKVEISVGIDREAFRLPADAAGDRLQIGTEIADRPYREVMQVLSGATTTSVVRADAAA